MENKKYAISVCCNGYTSSIPRTLYEILTHKPALFICGVCGNFCDVELKAAYLKKAKGIYSKILYK